MHKRIQRIATGCMLALLLLLFTLPGRYLARVCGEMTALLSEAETAALSGENAAPALASLARAYALHSDTLKLFLDHVSVDAVGAAIAACTPLAEPDALISAIHTVRAAIAHLIGIEAFTPANLL